MGVFQVGMGLSLGWLVSFNHAQPPFPNLNQVVSVPKPRQTLTMDADQKTATRPLNAPMMYFVIGGTCCPNDVTSTSSFCLCRPPQSERHLAILPHSRENVDLKGVYFSTVCFLKRFTVFGQIKLGVFTTTVCLKNICHRTN